VAFFDQKLLFSVHFYSNTHFNDVKLNKSGRVLDSVSIDDLSYSKLKLNLLLGKELIKFVVTPHGEIRLLCYKT